MKRKRKAPTQRIFIPVGDYVPGTNIYRCVRRWVWTRRHGLRVELKNGTECKSEYTLRELLRTPCPEGQIREVTPQR